LFVRGKLAHNGTGNPESHRTVGRLRSCETIPVRSPSEQF